MTLELTDKERELLVRLLQDDRRETCSELKHPADQGMRETLREERAMVERLLERLGAVAQPVR